MADVSSQPASAAVAAAEAVSAPGVGVAPPTIGELPVPSARSLPDVTTEAAAKRPKACERCWKRKQKCDRTLPACSSCMELGIECVARTQPLENLTEDAGLTHTSISSYVESLRRKVAQLEQGVTSPPNKRIRLEGSHVSPATTASTTHDGGHSVSSTLQTASENMMSAGGGADDPEEIDGEESSVRDTIGAIGFLSNSAMAEPRAGSVDEQGPHKLSLSELMTAALAIDGRDPSRSGPSQPPLVMDDSMIPLSKESTQGHMRRFLDYATLFLPYLSPHRLSQEYEELVEARNSPGGSADIPLLHRFDTYMALATGIAMSSEANHLSLVATSLQAAAVKLLPRIFEAQKPLEALHCMVMLLIYSLWSPHGGSPWHLMGLAMKTCISVGLHKEAGHNSETDLLGPFDSQWLFWTLYILDRSLGSVMDRPFSIQDQDISIPTPPTRDDLNRVPPHGGIGDRTALGAHIIRHAQLISDIRSRNGQDAFFCYSNLSFWRDFALARDASNRAGGVRERWLDDLDQLASRALTMISEPALINGNEALDGAAEIQQDARDACRRTIERLYELTTQGRYTSSAIDAYDILSAAVVYACLSHRATEPHEQSLTAAFEVTNKASTLITQAASRFPSLGALNQLLLKLSARLMEERSQPGQPPRTRFEEVPRIVPRRLRRFIHATFP